MKNFVQEREDNINLAFIAAVNDIKKSESFDLDVEVGSNASLSDNFNGAF